VFLVNKGDIKASAEAMKGVKEARNAEMKRIKLGRHSRGRNRPKTKGTPTTTASLSKNKTIVRPKFYIDLQVRVAQEKNAAKIRNRRRSKRNE
jgi:hypothetical protein